MSEESGLSQVLEFYGIVHRDVPRWQSIKCIDPSHEDRHKSARVNLEEEAYKCLGCGLSAPGVIQLIMKVEGIDRPSAEGRFKAITGGSYKRVSGSTPERRSRIDLSGKPGDYERGSGLLPSRSGEDTTRRSRIVP